MVCSDSKFLQWMIVFLLTMKLSTILNIYHNIFNDNFSSVAMSLQNIPYTISTPKSYLIRFLNTFVYLTVDQPEVINNINLC